MEDNATVPEPTLASVQVELDEEKAAHQDTLDALTKEQAEHADTIGELSAEQQAHAQTKLALAQVNESLAQAGEIIDGQKQTIAEQADRITSLQTTPSEFATIEVDKVLYQLEVKSFKYKGLDYTAKDLVADKKLQRELVKLGVGFIVKKEA